MKEIAISSQSPCQMIEITAEVQSIVTESGIESGAMLVYVPHTTAAVTINENADPDVSSDMLKKLHQLVPKHEGYRHAEGNSDGHIKSTLVGVSQTIAIINGRLALGTWQGIYFCEFDGPRQRRCYLKLLS